MRHERLERLGEMPGFLEAVAGRFRGERALEPGPGGGFCFVEQAWHLADLERCYGLRIRRILAEDRPALADFDGEREAREGRYRERSPEAGLAAFRQARAENLALLRAVSEALWGRPATQDGVGELRLEDLPRMMAEHDASHRGEIRELLGEPRSPEAPGRGSRGMAGALALLLAVPLLGCPYESGFPLGAPADTPREARLLGAWRCVSAFDEKSFRMTIAPFEERQYSIVMTQADEEPYETRAWVSSAKGGAILNAQEIKEGKPQPEWIFARFALPTRSSLVIDIAEDALLKDLERTPPVLRTAIEGPRADEIFEPYCACVRVEEERR
jgi:hypothetical protein